MPNRPSRNVNELGAQVGVEIGERALHALGLAGRARRVVHRRAGGAIFGHRRSAARSTRRRTTRSRGSCRARAAGSSGCPPRRPPRSRRRAKRSWLMNTFASASCRMYAISGAREAVVDRHVVEAGLQRREVHVHRVRAVGQHRRDRVALLHARAPAARAPPGWHARARRRPRARCRRGRRWRGSPGSSCCVLPESGHGWNLEHVLVTLARRGVWHTGRS